MLIGEFDVVDGGYYYITQTDLPGDLTEEGFDVLYYGGNEHLLNLEGVSLEGWVNESEDWNNAISFLPDDFIDYDVLPEGDTIDLYGLWWDPVMYGITYHANRSSSDTYIVEDTTWADNDGAITITGLDASDEGMQNDGKTFKGWNTAADGSGTWFKVDDQATLEQLGLGTRAEYVQDLEQLATLQIEEMPAYYDDAADANTSSDELEAQDVSDASTPSDELEAKLEDKYTTHLYAQWAEGTPTPAPTPTPTPTPTPDAKPGTKPASGALPRTGDATVPAPAVALIALAGMGALYVARRTRKDED